MSVALIISSLALVGVTFLLVIVTFALVIITRNYTSHTQRMAEVMNRDYTVRYGCSIYEHTYRQTQNEYAIDLKNIGQSKAFIRNVKILIVFSPTNKIAYFSNNNMVEIGVGDHSGYLVEALRIKEKRPGEEFGIEFTYERSGPDFNFEKREFDIDLDMEPLST